MECTVYALLRNTSKMNLQMCVIEMSENEVDRVDKHVEVWYKVSLCVGRVAV